MDTGDTGVRGIEQRGKCRSNVRRSEKAGKERIQGNRRNNNNKREVQGAFRETDRRNIRNPREEIEIAVNEMTDIRQELLAMEANDLLNEEPDKEEIIREMKNVKESTLGKDQLRMIYIKESGDEMKKELVKMVQFMFNNRAHRWEESLKTGRLGQIFKNGDKEVEGYNKGVVMLAMGNRILARVLTTRLKWWAEHLQLLVLNDNQKGFRQVRSTTDARQIMVGMQEDMVDIKKKEEQQRNWKAQWIRGRKTWKHVS